MGLNRDLGNIPEIVKIYGSNVGINTSSDNGYKLEIGGTLKASGAITGDSFVKIGGTSSQLLTADGSILTAGTGISISGGTISSTVTGGVTSFNTRTGAITLSSTDVTTALGYTPYNSTNPNGYISSYTETDPTVPSHVKSITTTEKSNWNTAFGWGNHASAGYVPTSRTITINGTSYDLSANRSWTVSGTVTSGVSITSAGSANNAPSTPSLNMGMYVDTYAFIDLSTANTNGGWIDFSKADGSDYGGRIRYVNGSDYFSISAGATEQVRIFNSNAEAIGSFRAPIFYDSNNTGYYVDPASTSNLNSVNAITLTASGTSYASATGGFASSTYATGVRNPIWRFGNADGYGLSYFQGTAGQDNVDTIGFHFGTATNSGSQFKLKGNGALYASAAIFSPILYDLDNTGYYCDPASTSNLALLSLYGHDNQLKINTYSGGASGWFAQEAGVNKWETYHYQGRYRWYSYTTNQEEAFLDNAGGFLQVRTSMRAPIFYDSNNTGYYCDPSNISNLFEVNVGDNSNGNQGVNIYYGNYTSGYGKIRFYQSGSNHQTIHSFSNSWQGGSLASTSSGAINLDGSNGVTIGPWNVPDLWVDKNGVGQARGSLRAPIFYDSNNTGYYVDPASTSYMGSIDSRGFYTSGNPWGTANSAWMPNGITTPSVTSWLYGNVYLGNAPANGAGTEATASGNVISTNAHYAAIFYDYNNSGYYVNPDGASRMNTINADVLRSYNDIYMDNDHGHTVVGLYSAYRFQGVFAMGDAYKLPVGGGSCGNHYGIAWSHPYAGGEAAHLTDHGMLVQVAGQTRVAISTDIWCIASITAYSDARVKDNIKVIDNPLERIKKVRGVTYTRTDLEDTSRKFAGVIAQEMREALPEVVSEDSNGQLSVAYGNSIGLLIECVKEQQTQIEQLKELVNQLINK